MTGAVMTIEEFKSMQRGPLRGWVRVKMPSGLVLHDVGIFCADGRAWASAPSKAIIGRDGVQMRTKDGKPHYTPVISFETRALAQRFSDLVIAALRLSHPDALPTQTPEIVNV